MYNQDVKDQKELIKKKYAANIMSFYEAHGMDEGVCLDMLLFNAHCFMKGATAEVIPGGGVINIAELIEDVQKLDDLKIKMVAKK